MKSLSELTADGESFNFPELAEFGSMNARELLSEVMPDFAESIPEDMTMEEFGDIQRVMVQVTDVVAFTAFLNALPGWSLTVADERPEGGERFIRPGARIGSVSFQGDDVPAFAFPGVTMAFDKTDPALNFFQSEIAQECGKSGSAFLFATADPLFQGVVLSSGMLRSFVLHGGWLYTKGIWSPFLISSQGPDDALAQRKYHRGDLASRGLIRERGLDAALMNDVYTYQARLLTVRNYREEIFSEDGPVNVPETSGPLPNFTIATDQSGWNILADEAMASLFGRG